MIPGVRWYSFNTEKETLIQKKTEDDLAGGTDSTVGPCQQMGLQQESRDILDNLLKEFTKKWAILSTVILADNTQMNFLL